MSAYESRAARNGVGHGGRGHRLASCDCGGLGVGRDAVPRGPAQERDRRECGETGPLGAAGKRNAFVHGDVPFLRSRVGCARGASIRHIPLDGMSPVEAVTRALHLCKEGTPWNGVPAATSELRSVWDG